MKRSAAKMLRFLGLAGDDEPEQSNNARSKSREELEAVQREAVAKAIRAEDRRAELEMEVDACSSKNIRTIRYYFDSETLDWKEAICIDGNSFYKARPFSSLPNPISRWDSIKGFFKSLWTDENDKDPEAATQHEKVLERRRRAMYLKKHEIRPIWVAKRAERLWQDQEEEENSYSWIVGQNVAEIERNWTRWTELKQQQKREEELTGTGTCKSPEEGPLNAAKRRRVMTLEEEDLEKSEIVETAAAADSLPKTANSQENLLDDKIKDRRCSSSSTDSPWPPKTPRSNLAGRPKSFEVDSTPEGTLEELIWIKVDEHFARMERLLCWVERSPFANAEEQKVAKNIRPKTPSSSNYGADSSDHSDRFASFLAKKRKRERQLAKFRMSWNCIILWSDPVSDLIQAVPAYEPARTSLKGAFSQSIVNTTMLACDMIPGLMTKIVQIARIGRFETASRPFEIRRETRRKIVPRRYIGAYAREMSEYSDDSFMSEKYKRQGQLNCNVIIRWLEPITVVAQVFAAYEPINSRFKDAFSETKIHETIRVCDMKPGFLARIVQFARIRKFWSATRFVDY